MDDCLVLRHDYKQTAPLPSLIQLHLWQSKGLGRFLKSIALLFQSLAVEYVGEA